LSCELFRIPVKSNSEDAFFLSRPAAGTRKRWLQPSPTQRRERSARCEASAQINNCRSQGTIRAMRNHDNIVVFIHQLDLLRNPLHDDVGPTALNATPLHPHDPARRGRLDIGILAIIEYK